MICRSEMVGREVRDWYCGPGVVLRWEPLGAGMCDVLVRFEDGREIWHSSCSLRPHGALREVPLPSRQQAQEEARLRTIESLKVIRADLVAKLRSERWPGLEHGKALLGMAIDGALEDCQRV